MKNTHPFERAFVALISERLEKAGMSGQEFGRQVFGVDGGRSWRACREETRKRGVSLGEAYRMAEVLGVNFPELIWQITQEAKSKDLI